MKHNISSPTTTILEKLFHRYKNLATKEVITATLKVISAITKVILGTEEVSRATLKVISANTKVILATEEDNIDNALTSQILQCKSLS